MFKEYITNILSCVAIVVSFAAIIYARKNIKTQKYIETITKQRISWIDTLRNDFSDILAHSETISYCKYVEQIDDKVGFEGNPDEERGYNEFIKSMISEKIRLESLNLNIVAKIELSILRLNENDDSKLIEQLEDLKEIYRKRNYSQINEKVIRDLRTEIKIILKSEWEKVKSETVKGGIVK